MSSNKKSIDEIWRELNARPTGRSGTMGAVLGGSTNMPGVTTTSRVLPPPHAVALATPLPSPMLTMGEPGTMATESKRSASHYDPTRAGVSPEALQAYLSTIQRTINCLSDPDRSTRKQAIASLLARLLPRQDRAGSKAHESGPAPEPAMLQALICGPLLHPVAAMLHDPGEGARLAAVELLQGAAALVPDFSATLPVFLSEVVRRMGQLPVVEPAEEVRLLLTGLVLAIVQGSSASTLQAYAGDVCQFLLRALEDGFHDIKKAACACLCTLSARAWPTSLEPHSEKLLQALLPNIQHQHSRVRLVVIEALGALVSGGCVAAGLVESLVCPALRPVAYDKSPAVREALFVAIARWLGYDSFDQKQSQGTDVTSSSPAPAVARAAVVQSSLSTSSCLLPLLLVGISDALPALASHTLQLVEGVGLGWSGGGSSSLSGGRTEDVASASVAASPQLMEDVQQVDEEGERAAEAAARAIQLGPPFTGRPGTGARRMVRDLLPLLLAPLLAEVGEWTVGQRACAARQLHSVLVLSERSVEAHLPRLLPALCSAIGDEDVEVAGRIISAVHVVGAHVGPRRWLPLMLDNVSNARLSLTQKANTLVVLSGLLHSTSKVVMTLPSDQVAAAVPTEVLVSLTNALASEELRASEHSAIRNQLLAVATNMMRWLGPRCCEVVQQMYTLLLQLYGFERDVARQEPIKQAMAELAETCGRPFDDLAEAYGPAVMEAACSSSDKWVADAPGYLVFRALLLTSGPATLSRLVSRLCSALQPLLADQEGDAALRLNALQLLDSVMEDQDRGLSFGGEAAAAVLSQLLLPPLVWRAGKSSAAVRFAAITALATMLRRRLAPHAVLLDLVASGALLPPLSQSLDEDWYTDLRNTACFVIAELMLAVGSAMSAEARRALYPELLKRLDDSSNQVRISACQALRAFCTSMPPSYCDTNTGYLVQGVVIHMDDSNAEVQEAACAVLEALAAVKPTVVASEVAKVRERFRSKHYCDRVLAACQ